MRALILGILLILAPASAGAQTLTARDIIALTRAGLGEEVLLALIEVHRPVFPVDADTLKMLTDAGVRQNVIVAMIKSGREVPNAEPVSEPEPLSTRAAPPPQVVVVEHEYPREERTIREIIVPVAVPVYVPLRVHRPRHLEPVRRAEHVYWGFGGKLRPDAWTPIEHRKREIAIDVPQKK